MAAKGTRETSSRHFGMMIAVLVGIAIGYGMCSGDPVGILMNLPRIALNILQELLNTLQGLVR